MLWTVSKRLVSKHVGTHVQSQNVLTTTEHCVYSYMMIARRRLTLARSFSLAAALLVITLLILLSKNYPLDIITAFHARVAETFMHSNVPLSAAGGDGFHRARTKASTPCTLHHLRRGRLTQNEAQFPQCRRVQPVPGSCDVAERLFFTSPPATCDDEHSVEICKLMKTGKHPTVQCSDQQCPASLFGATVNSHTGRLLWRRFKSAQALEKWVNNLLQPSQKKEHFGFCFLGCTGDWADFDGEEADIWGDTFEAIQILLLPPSVFSTRSAGTSHHSKSKTDVNFNLLFIDSVSRQHFFRSLPRTVELFEKWSSNNDSSKVTVLDFELVQAVRSRTFETLQALFAGEIDPSVKPFGVLELPPEPLKTEALLMSLKKKGYSTLWLEDLCYLWEWGISKDLLVHNKTLSREQTWRRMQQALSNAGIDSLEVTYAMCGILSKNGVPDHFHGPDAVCFNGRHQHDYLLEYLLLYQESLSKAGTPFFTFMETNVGHEDTGRRIQTLDNSLRNYLERVVAQKNTLTIIMSDHGNSYGPYLGETMEGRMELFHPLLFILVPEKLAGSLGPNAVDALQQNQHRLISVLDLHYMLQSLAQGSESRVAPRHRGYNVSGRGLLSLISANRSCNHIPRIMPNLCICEDFDMLAESDDYHALFAHLAVGKINNEIQRQFRQQALRAGSKPGRGFGHCQRLHLAAFSNTRKSFLGGTISLKMDLHVPLGGATRGSMDDPGWDFQGTSSSPNDQMEIFFVAMQARLGRDNSSTGSIVLETLDRITPYSKFSVCADSTVKLQLCLCDVNVTKGRDVDTKLPTAEELGDEGLFLRSDVYVAEHTEKCLVLVVRKNRHGGVFSVANVCKGRMFEVLFTLETSQMIVSDAMPRQETVFPGHELFLCMAVKNAPQANWSWSFSLQHRPQYL